MILERPPQIPWGSCTKRIVDSIVPRPLRETILMLAFNEDSEAVDVRDPVIPGSHDRLSGRTLDVLLCYWHTTDVQQKQKWTKEKRVILACLFLSFKNIFREK